ncbi:hypothetical protein C8R46DRAFT_1024581 [Mycena filopes]|nr:hypothetical protein C8R46DRAFT_1024581 [Mycena filopes]
MFSKTLFLVFACAASVHAAAIANQRARMQARQQHNTGPPVFTATRVYQTITDVPPYIVTATTTMTWTYVLDHCILILIRCADEFITTRSQSPSTTIAHPTGPGGLGGHA